MTICLTVAVLAFGLLIAADNLWMLYLFAALYGISLWASGGIISPLVAEFFGLKAHGALFGATVLSAAVGGAIGPLVVGYIYDTTGSYRWAFALCLVIISISLGIILSTLKAKTWRESNS